MAEETLFDAGRALRPYLTSLLGPDEARDLDRRLLDLLRQRGQPGLETDLAALLTTSSEAVHRWVASFVEHGVPPEVHHDLERSADAGYRPLDTRPNSPVVPALRYVCPADGLIALYLLETPEADPLCPEHGVALVRG